MVLCHGRLRRLRCKSVFDDMRLHQLQPAMVAGLAMGASLEVLSLDVPEDCSVAVVEDAFRSLNKSLKVCPTLLVPPTAHASTAVCGLRAPAFTARTSGSLIMWQASTAACFGKWF